MSFSWHWRAIYTNGETIDEVGELGHQPNSFGNVDVDRLHAVQWVPDIGGPMVTVMVDAGKEVSPFRRKSVIVNTSLSDSSELPDIYCMRIGGEYLFILDDGSVFVSSSLNPPELS